MDVTAFFGDGGGGVAHRQNHVVRGNVGGVAVLIGDGDAAVGDGVQLGFQTNVHLIGFEEITEITGVGQRYAAAVHQVVLHLHNDRGLTLAVQVIGNLTAGETTAHNNHSFTHRLVTQQVIHRLDGGIRAADGQTAGNGTRSHHDFIRLNGGQVGDGGVQFHLNGVFLHLAAIPRDELLILLFKVGGGGGNKYAAQLAALLVQRHAVTPFGGHQRGFHTTDTAADNGNMLRLFGGGDVVFFALHRLGVDGAAGQTHGIGQILAVGVTLSRGEIETTRVTADAGTDVLQTVLNQLGDPLRIRQELTGNTHTVDASCGHRLSTHLGLHTTGTHHGDIHELLDVCHVL